MASPEFERKAQLALQLATTNRKRRGAFPGCDVHDVHHDAMVELLTDRRLTVKKAVNRVVSRIRTKQYQRKKRGLAQEHPLGDHQPAARGGVLKTVVQREAWRGLYAVLHKLTREDGVIWECRWIGHSYREIGAKVGKSHAYVRKREQAIIELLAQELDGFDFDDFF